MTHQLTGPDSSRGRASASGSGGRRFDPRPRHTKGVQNGTGSSLTDARNIRVVPGRYKKAGEYLLLIFEPRLEKPGFLPRRKQRRRSDSQ